MQKLVRIFREIRIRAYKRYVPFTTKYPGFICHVIDKSSFLSMCDEIFDREIYKFKSTTDTPVIIDCGANIGLSTIYFKTKYPLAKIISFEPDPYVFETLTKNIELTNNNGITLINKGLGKISETKKFFSEGADGGRIALPEDDQNIISIEIEILSPYLKEPVDMLKIDIEGSELEVLEESSNELKNVKNIFIEYHSVDNKEQGLDRILFLLSKAGFRYYIESTGVNSKYPFIKIEKHLNYDNQLNIFGYRE